MNQVFVLFNSEHKPCINVPLGHNHDDTKGMNPLSERKIKESKCCCVKHCTMVMDTDGKSGFHIWKLASVIDYLCMIRIPAIFNDTKGIGPLSERKINFRKKLLL